MTAVVSLPALIPSLVLPLSAFIYAWEQQLRQTAGTVWVAQTHCRGFFLLLSTLKGICVYNEQSTQNASL